MHTFTKLGVASVAALALTVPALGTVADAAPAGHQSSATSHPVAAKKKAAKLKLKRSAKGVQPGIGKEKITAVNAGKGKVKFVVKGDAGGVKKTVKVKKGKAVFKVPPLGTGKYKVTAKASNGRKGKTKFEVYDSLLTVNQTTYTYSLASNNCYDQPDLTGSIRFKGKAATTGFADVYQDGKIKGGSESPSFLGFGGVNTDGTFLYSSFLCDVVDGGAGNLGPHGPGTYSFNVYYTDGPEFADYISSNTIIVNITA